MPKKQTTAAKKARAAQRTAGGKYTDLLAGQVCGQSVHPLDDSLGVCARPPHSSWEPCSKDWGFDPVEFYRAEGERLAEQQARWEAMSPVEREEAEARHHEWLYDHDDEQPSDRIDFEDAE